MKKKLFAILLSIVMVAGLLPATALAAEPTVYDIWVDGVQVTSENKDNLFSGTVSYDPTTHTLFLNNATLDNDTMSDYGIKTTIPSTLKIRLTGTNSITRTDPGGGVGIYLNYSNSVEITGDGTLVINVIGENYDGISTGADVKISDKARVIINSEGGLGITGRMVKIDGATVDSTGLYAGIDAHWLKIINGADVTLKATQDGRNGAYIWKDQEGNGGDIELAASKVTATSYYPSLFAAGNLTVDGGQVSCTSTADGALWARGNILIKGGAKVTTDGKYPMGGNGSFTVEEAEIDAKNTNENNIPAIFDECVPVIADGYHLNYAKAVDSEGTEIDLLSSGTQYFALYKNVHFITKAVYPVSFVVTPDGLTNVVVKVNGQEVTGSVSLEAGTYPVEVTADNCKAYTGNITITADAATHTQTIAMTYFPADYIKIEVPFKLTVKKTGEMDPGKETFKFAIENSVPPPNMCWFRIPLRPKAKRPTRVNLSSRSKKIRQAISQRASSSVRSREMQKAGLTTRQSSMRYRCLLIPTPMLRAGLSCKFDENAELDYNNPIEEIGFTNSYSAKKPVDSFATEPTTPDIPHNPRRPAIHSNLWFCGLPCAFISGGATIGTTVVSRKKKYNK